MILFIVVLVVLMWIGLALQIRKAEARATRVEALVLRIAQAQGLPDGGWELDRVRAVLANDPQDIVNAVREYRRITGASLVGSKRAVDQLQADIASH